MTNREQVFYIKITYFLIHCNILYLVKYKYVSWISEYIGVNFISNIYM